jgi:hypothetical protein
MRHSRRSNKKNRAESLPLLPALPSLKLPTRKSFWVRQLLLIALTAFLWPVGWLIGREIIELTPYPMVARPSPIAKPPGFVPNLEHFAMLSPSQLEGTDIAVFNLVCSQGLPGGDQDMATALKNLDIMA